MKTVLYALAALFIASGLIKLGIALVQWRKERRNG